jgi:hypothetical protein
MSAVVFSRRRSAALSTVVLILAVVALFAIPPGVGASPSSPAHSSMPPVARVAAPVLATPASSGSHALRPAAGTPTASSLLDPAAGVIARPTALPGTGPGPSASDPSNTELDNFSSTTSVAQVGASNQSVVVGATDASQAYVTDDGLGYFCCHGLSAAYRTNNGGVSWSTGWVGLNASWSNTKSWSYGDFPFGEPSLAGGSNGTVLYASIYVQPCAYYAGEVPCNSTVGLPAPAGIAVSRSINSGVSWQAPVPINNQSWYKFFSIVCGTTTYSGPLPANISGKPSLAYASAAGLAVVAWDVVSYDLSLSCQGGVGVYTINSISYFTEVSTSTNNGITWSVPHTIGRVASVAPSVAVGPAPGYDLSVVYSDYVNGTSSTYTFAFSQSTDRGVKWTAPADIGPTTLVHPTLGAPPDAFATPSIASIAVDNWTDSSYRSTIYVVWGDNRTAAASGSPSVELVRSTSGGSSWSGATIVDAATAHAQYFEPTVTVGPEGRVWIVFYEMDPADGGYQLYGQYSVDGGAHWTSPFAIADTAGYPGPLVTSIGDWVGAAATSAGLYSAWTDCRWSGCPQNGDTAAYAALTGPVSVTSTVPGVFATSIADGVTAASTTPLATGWDEGASVAVNVSAWVTYGNTSRYVAVFSNFSGIATSSSDSVFFGYPGGSTLSANYVAQPAAWISGTVSPVSGSPVVTVDGAPVPLTPWNATTLQFNVTVEAGASYRVVATGEEYTTFFTNLSTSAFRVSPLTISLARMDGWIHGTLLPPTATLTVNNTPVASVNQSTGRFNVTVGWGSYWVNASGTGLTATSQYVTVAPGLGTLVNAGLVGGWIDGVVAPTNATVRIDGNVVTLTSGSFNVSVLGGSHTVSASLRGYTSFSETLSISPTQQINLVISLTDFGWIRGTVSPITASVVVGGNLVAVVGGAVNVSLLAGATYNVTVAVAGYSDGWKNVLVTPGNVSFANFTLTPLASTCTSDCGSKNSTPPATTTTSLPFSWLDVAIAAVVVLGAALAVAFLLMRGPGDDGPPPEVEAAPPTEPAPDEEIYGANGSSAAWDEGPPSGGAPPPS